MSDSPQIRVYDSNRDMEREYTLVVPAHWLIHETWPRIKLTWWLLKLIWKVKP